MLNTHQEYGVTSRHIRCSSWDKRSTPYLVCIARFFFYSVELGGAGASPQNLILVAIALCRAIFMHKSEAKYRVAGKQQSHVSPLFQYDACQPCSSNC